MFNARGAVLGIDLGTTNTSAVAFPPGAEKAVSILHGRNQAVMPSVVALAHPQTPLVGWLAKDMLLTHPETTISGWKRFIGRSERSEFVSRFKDRMSYRIYADPYGNLGAVVDGRVVTFVEIAALVLEQVRLQTSAALRTPVEDAVIAVPAHFGNAQRTAILEAGQRAGLKVLRLVNEPTAAALAFGIGHQLNCRVLVFDLGGGTFDATLLEISDNIFDVRATRGEGFLGGIDFDRALRDRLVSFMKARHRVDLRASPIVVQRVMTAAETAKVALSEQTEVDIHVPAVAQRSNQTLIDLDYHLTRAELEELTAPFVEACMGLVEAMLVDAGVPIEEVGYVAAVGGQSRMPLVQARLSQLIGKRPLKQLNSNTSVAYGAALVARGETDLAGPVLIDVLSVPIGLVLPGGKTEWLFPSDTTLPSETELAIEAPISGREMVFGLWQGPDITSAERQVLGVLRVPPQAFSGPGPFRLCFKLHMNLSIEVKLKDGLRSLNLRLEASGSQG